MPISPAYAQAGGAPVGFDLISLMPLLLIFVVFYFLLIRPQQKKQKVAIEDGAPAQGIEQIDDGTTYEEQPMTTTVLDENGNEVEVPLRKAPGPKILGTLSGSNYQGDNGFQGKVLVPAGQGEAQAAGSAAKSGGYDSGGQVLVAPSESASGGGDDNPLVPEKVETAALGGSEDRSIASVADTGTKSCPAK